MEIDLLRLARALWDHVLVIVLSAVICGVIALGFTQFFITPMYRATALMYVNNSSISVGSTKVSISASDLTAAQNLVDTYIVILKSRTTLNEVIKKAEVDYTYEELYKMISSGSVNNTEIFNVDVTGPDPAEAEKIANTIAEVLPNKIAAIVDGSSVRIVDYAVLPAKKDSPSLSRNGMMGILLGLVLSCGAIILMELFDELIHDEDYLIETYHLPILAVVPDLQSTEKSSNYSNYYYKATDSDRRKKHAQTKKTDR